MRHSLFAILGLWILLSAIPRAGHAQPNAETLLLGRWTVTVDGQPRPRILEVLSVDADGKAQAAFGWANGQPGLANIAVTAADTAVSFDLVTPTGARFNARSIAPDRMEGVFTTTDGKTLPAKARLHSRVASLFSPGVQPSPAQLEARLYGSWVVNIGTQERTRTLEIRSVEDADGKFSAESVYGWTDGKLLPTPMNIAIRNGGLVVDLITPAKSRIRARLVAPELLEGILLTEGGKSYWATFKLAGNEDAALPAGKRARKLTLIYVGADNCPSCTRWETTRTGNDPMASKKAFLETAEGRAVTFHHIQAGSYINTLQDRYWPEELRWVRDKTHVASGTPRFVLLADDAVVINTTRASNLVEKIMPRIRELANLPR